jgi:hypothetical protein
VGGDWRPAVALRASCVVQRVLHHREEAIHRVLGYAELDPHGLEIFSDAAHHHLDCPVGPRAVRRCKMMRSSIDPTQLLNYLVLIVGALIGHLIRYYAIGYLDPEVILLARTTIMPLVTLVRKLSY